MEEKEVESGVSTSASGPAGPHFEAQVSAFYFLSMLAGAPPRGLPGTRVTRVLLQQANADRPLDDVIVYATDSSGNQAVLEIQVKRSITFAKADSIFKKVVGQIAQAMQRTDFWTTKYNLAIATSKGSWKIDGPYQDVLSIARQMGDAETFTSQLTLPGVANDDMRTFVATLQSHLKEFKAPNDDETVWQLLRRLHILTFDFTAIGSASEDLCRERSLRVLHTDEASKVDAFWRSLIEHSINIAKNGGDNDREALINHISQIGYKLANDRRHFNTISTIGESASQALADIDNQVANVVLTRREQIMAVQAAFDTGRYVEIRGEAGVGKSGILKQIAESQQAQGNVLVFSPRRCVPGGWQALKAQLDFDGTRARELLVELANGGGAIIFIDNLDMFTEDERLTVVDMLRGAADVEGVSVLATARTDFGVEDPSWLPKDALSKLKCADPIIIDELSDSEIEQLKNNAPRLSYLLSDSHPARKVTRNLFRLARIANKPASDPIPHTEAEMAYDWWKSGDGKPDSNRLDRRRLLEKLAKEALSGPAGLDVSNSPSNAIDALVQSGSLTSLGPSRVSFRHDVLLEWSIACLLFEQQDLIKVLDLNKPASAILSRSIELTSRLCLERSPAGSEWNSLLETLSSKDNHKTWRRAAILAVARCEAIEAILPKIQLTLISDNAVLLRELLRTIQAVEVIPGSKAFEYLKSDPKIDFKFLESLSIPKGSSWRPIISWLLDMKGGIPKLAVPEATSFFNSFAVGTGGRTDSTKDTTRQIYDWLKQLQAFKDITVFEAKSSEWDVLDHEQIDSLYEDLINGFKFYARSTPALAKEFLTELATLKSDDRLIIDILKSRGTLAAAAPEELAKLTEHALIGKHDPKRRQTYREQREALTYVDHEFIPYSPAQGPFFELLQHAPKVGLQLIHNLVSHVISHYTGNEDAGENKISIVFAGGVRHFNWQQSFPWSRNCDAYSITSALKALEAWAHIRIEKGDLFEEVLHDVLGPPGSCAAYLLVAVDLIISHWPRSASSAIEFLACPELLCLDEERFRHDSLFGTTGSIGFRPLIQEPYGVVSNALLDQKPSRKESLDGLIRKFTFRKIPEDTNKLIGLLRDAAKRTGEINDDSTYLSPEFRVVRALNLLNKQNWKDTVLTSQDGTEFAAKEYVPSIAEQQLIHKLSAVSASKRTDFFVKDLISNAIENSATLTHEQIVSAADWAVNLNVKLSSEDNDDLYVERMQNEAILATAMMIFRDGDDSLKLKYGEWASTQITCTLASTKLNHTVLHNDSLKYNVQALAYAGALYKLSGELNPQEVRYVLEITTKKTQDVFAGFGKVIASSSDFNDRLQKSILRCALTACVVPVRKWNPSTYEDDCSEDTTPTSSTDAINPELKWLFESDDEPAWPSFPAKAPRRKKGIRIPNPIQLLESTDSLEPNSVDFRVYQQTASSWLRQLQYRDPTKPCQWIGEIVHAYMPWSILSSGANLASHEEADDVPREWNIEFFKLVASNIVFTDPQDVIANYVTPITTLPDRDFYDVSSIFLKAVDVAYFNGDDQFDTQLAVDIRTALANRLVTTDGWERLKGTKEFTIERRIASIIAVLFFNDYGFSSDTKCYLLEKGVARLEPFLPVLLKLTHSGPSPFSALVLLNLIEVSPKVEHLNFMAETAKCLLKTYPDLRNFWIDQGFGKRWCEIIKSIFTQDVQMSSKVTQNYYEVLAILSELISLGIPEATQLEEQINGR